MKIPAIFLTLVLVAISHQQEELPTKVVKFWSQHIDPYIEECKIETGFENLDRYHNLIHYKEVPYDRDLGCFINCYASSGRLNLISDAGDYLVDNVYKLVGAAPGEIAIEHCRDVKTDDPCESALLYVQCAYQLVAIWQDAQK